MLSALPHAFGITVKGCERKRRAQIKKTVALVILSVLLLVFCSSSASAVAGYELEDKAAEPAIVLTNCDSDGNKQAGWLFSSQR